MDEKVKKNYLLNLLYEIYLLIIPVVVTPYVARVLGENGSGHYSFTFSINSYYVLFAALGFSVYAQRLIASHQGDSHQQTIDFWEVIIARIITCVFTIIVYFASIVTNAYGDKYNLLMLLLSLNIFAVLFDINFFFQGNEDFTKIVIRSIAIKSISIICIFKFVNSQDDLWLYTLIQSVSTIASNIAIWVYMPRYLEKIKLNELHPLKHIKPTVILFIPTIATSIYTSLDKTLIGVITNNDAENGNYEYAEKLVKMILTVLTSMGTVMTPRNSKRFAEGDHDGVVSNIYLTSKFVFFLGVPLMFGTIAVADHLIPWYLGSGYDKAANLMKILSPIIIVIGLSNVFGRQFLLPSKQDKRYTTSVVCGAIVNFCLNIPLIYLFQSYGASIATVVAECVVTGLMLHYIKDDIDFRIIVKESKQYILWGCIMLIVCKLVASMLQPGFLSSVIIFVVGAVTYSVELIITKDQMFYRMIKHNH